MCVKMAAKLQTFCWHGEAKELDDVCAITSRRLDRLFIRSAVKHIQVTQHYKT